MTFKEAFIKMVEGHKIKRPSFEGYWYIHGQSGQVTIHLKDGKEITSGYLTLTIMNCMADDWMICDD